MEAPPVNETPAKREIKSVEDVLAKLSELAEYGEGATKTQALRMLLAYKSEVEVATLPAPMTPIDRVKRLGRLMRFMGKDETRRAYLYTWPKTRTLIPKKEADMPRVTIDEIDWELYGKLPTTLKTLYRRFPEIKPQAGHPKGYPVGRSLEAKALWCKGIAQQIILEREQDRLKRLAVAEHEIQEKAL